MRPTCSNSRSPCLPTMRSGRRPLPRSRQVRRPIRRGPPRSPARSPATKLRTTSISGRAPRICSDIRDQVLSSYLREGRRVRPGAILFGDDMAPTRFLETDWGRRGIALLEGQFGSHVAMLARARGVPMVVGLGACGQRVAGPRCSTAKWRHRLQPTAGDSERSASRRALLASAAIDRIRACIEAGDDR